MVRWWDIQIDKGIALSKMRIKHHEKHGVGNATIRDKQILEKQERHKKVRKDKL